MRHICFSLGNLFVSSRFYKKICSIGLVDVEGIVVTTYSNLGVQLDEFERLLLIDSIELNMWNFPNLFFPSFLFSSYV